MTVGPAASCATNASTAVSSSIAGTAAWIAPHAAASAPESSRPSSSSSRARTSPTRRGSNQVAPLSGVNPRCANGSHKRVARRDREVGGEREREPDARRAPAHLAHDRHLHLEEERDQVMRLRRQPALDAAGARLRRVRVSAVARHDVGAAAEVLAGAVEQDDAHPIVGRGDGERVDEPFHHHVVDRVALVGPVERDAQHALVDPDREPGDGRSSPEPSVIAENSTEMASSAPCRSRAPPGGSGSRTAPRSRLGSRIVA